MFNSQNSVIAVLLGIEVFVLFLSGYSRTKFLFKFLPAVFWIYFLPMLASTFKIIPKGHVVYKDISLFFLPASLVLLVLSANLRQLRKLGGIAMIMMLSGTLGIMLGGPLTLLLFKKWLPADIWMGFGALSGSWVGGSANMIAVKEGIGAPDSVFFPMVVVDSVVAYSWMGILIMLAGYQNIYDRWNGSNTQVLEDLHKESFSSLKTSVVSFSVKKALIIFTVASIGAILSLHLASFIPEIKNMITTYTWTIVLASVFGIILSFTPVKKLEYWQASEIGYVLLYFVLASIGARASLTDIFSMPILIVAGFVWVLIHAGFIFAASRLLKAPMFLAAVASQANIGGTVSAPAVAAIYQPALAPVGLLLAIIGNIIGTYTGIICAQMCRFVSR